MPAGFHISAEVGKKLCSADKRHLSKESCIKINLWAEVIDLVTKLIIYTQYEQVSSRSSINIIRETKLKVEFLDY